MKYRKYSFATEAAFNEVKAAIIVQPIDEVEQPQIKYNAIPVTCILESAVIEDGVLVKDAVIDPNYNVDIVWEGEEPTEFIPFQVWPSNVGQHIVMGWESAYIQQDRKKALNIVEPDLNVKK
jgi:hypothetical protein